MAKDLLRRSRSKFAGKKLYQALIISSLVSKRNEPVSSCNIQSDETGSVRPGAKDTGVNGAIVVPIRNAGGEAYGALGIGVRRAYDYTAEETARLLAVATQLI